MASDYAEIRDDNERRYGTDIGRIGPMLLTDRYADRTHFIFELLQNAEDALALRPEWTGSRAVEFELSKRELRVTHWGKPFDGNDVRGVCGIAESTKNWNAIGRFGIGFKSVYEFTDRPEIHSGKEDFAIENFVWPVEAGPIDRDADQTIIIIPFKEREDQTRDEILHGMRSLGPMTLLFLRQIEEVSWKVEDGPTGMYVRTELDHLNNTMRRIQVIGEEEGEPEKKETWLICSRDKQIFSGGAAAKVVEIAFRMAKDEQDEWSIQPVRGSPLVVFFPTVLETHLSFLLQGPYRTTPSRDNVPQADLWNKRLVRQTALLLVQTLRWFRDNSLLGLDVLRCLPLDRNKFAERTMFKPIFDSVRTALLSERLLPTHGGEYAPANEMRVARTEELRRLLSPTQLGSLFGSGTARTELSWLSGDITQDREPELRRYIVRELGVPEVTPEDLLQKLTKSFLESQSDEWVTRLYEFVAGQPALARQCRKSSIPLVRLTDGSHVAAFEDDQPKAFLPSSITTSFPTVRLSICQPQEAYKFLISLGLTEPDPVDDVVRNILPKYRPNEAPDDEGYEIDIQRIMNAFNTDSNKQREKLVSALRETEFVRAVDGEGTTFVTMPRELYLATERLKELFSGVPDVLLVDDSYSCLRGEDICEMMEVCGAQRYLRPIPIDAEFTWEERRSMRRAAGCEGSSRRDRVYDYTLHGFDSLLGVLRKSDPITAARKASLLWGALVDLQEGRGGQSFVGTYEWFYVNSQSCTFHAAFVRTLNRVEWIPNPDRSLVTPEFVSFDSLDWEDNPFLRSIILFKPPAIEALAREAGIESGVLDLLKKLGLTSEAQLRRRLGVRASPGSGAGITSEVKGAIGKPPGGVPETTIAVPLPGGIDTPRKAAAIESLDQALAGGAAEIVRSDGNVRSAEPAEPHPRRAESQDHQAQRSFVSYVAVDPEEEGGDPDGIDHKARMDLEEKAIALVLAYEPRLQRTPTHNPGYDLFESVGEAVVRWIEVKAMAGSLRDRPVGMSHFQFEFARQRGEAYWLYVVEHSSSDENARIVRINNPAGKSKTFTFDHGWLSVAEVSSAAAQSGASERAPLQPARYVARRVTPGS